MNTEVVRNETKIELVLALDNTGSMSGSKIAALRTASEGLVNILFGDDDESDYVKVGLVPFAAAVNVGVDKTNSGWIDLGAQSSIHGEDFSSAVNLFDMFGGLGRVWNGCVRARPAPYDANDAIPVVGTPNTLFVPFLAPDEPGNAGSPESGYGNSYLNDAYAGGGKKDKKDKDKKGGGGCDGNASATLRQQCPYKYAVAPSGGSPDKNCPPQAILALTNDKSDIVDEIQAMVASGSTVIPEGLAWGWRVISPTAPYTEGSAYGEDNTIKAIVLLTDGENSVGGGGNGHNKSIYSAFGYAAKGHLGNVNGSDAESNLNAKTATLCTNIKAAGIRIYTITLQVSNIPTQNLMRNCATETSMYYNTTSGADLGNVFEGIALGLNKLRISK